MDHRIVSTIHIAGLVKKIVVLSIHIAVTAKDDIDLAICIAPSIACILKPSICIVGRRRNMLNEKYRITHRLVQGVVSFNIADNVLIGCIFQLLPLTAIQTM